MNDSFIEHMYTKCIGCHLINPASGLIDGLVMVKNIQPLFQIICLYSEKEHGICIVWDGCSRKLVIYPADFEHMCSIILILSQAFYDWTDQSNSTFIHMLLTIQEKKQLHLLGNPPNDCIYIVYWFLIMNAKWGR